MGPPMVKPYSRGYLSGQRTATIQPRKVLQLGGTLASEKHVAVPSGSHRQSMIPYPVEALLEKDEVRAHDVEIKTY